MNKKLLKSFCIMMIGLFTFASFANGTRVIEVQENIKSDISKFLEKFAPNSKYSVQVKIKPLRRKYENNSQSENLPFMEFENEMVMDEWENPATNIYNLYSRIAEARVSIYLEEKVKVEDLQKFKDAILTDVNLVPGRDSVTIEVISSPVIQNTFNWKDQTEILLLGVMLMIAVILGVGLNSLSNKISPQKVTQTNPAKGEAIAAAPSPTPPSISAGGEFNRGHNNQGINELKGDLNIQDPSKINEVVGKKIAKLIKSEIFPTLNDMVILEELLKEDPSSFSYLIFEFPQDVQKNIYQLGKGEGWFKGFTEVGFPSKTVMISLDRMLRDRTVSHSTNFEDLLIRVWRLDQKLDDFVQSLTKEQAFSILYYLPKDISIPVSRTFFPGSWGSILDDKPLNQLTDLEEIEKITSLALKLKPYLNFESLEVFKNRKDLLKYLDNVEPHEERDIYSVISSGSDLEQTRPPFFKFFDLDKNERMVIFKKYSINDWAIACFDIGRNEKEKITELMDEKERYLFGHLLRSFDESQFQNQYKFIIRKEISKFVYENFNRFSSMDKDREAIAEEIINHSEEKNVA